MSTDSHSDADYHTGSPGHSGSGTASDWDHRYDYATAAAGVTELASTAAAVAAVFVAFPVVAVVFGRSGIANTI